MKDEFLFYLNEEIGSRLIISFDNTDLLVWGSRRKNTVKLDGLTLNIGVKDLQRLDQVVADNRIEKAMKVASSLSHSSQSAFFAIVYAQLGADAFKVTDPKDPMNWADSLTVREAEMPELIQRFLKTGFPSRGTAKPVNRQTSDWFHVWARANLPREYVRVNIDGLVLDRKGNPRILLETKRSFYDVDSWEPWRNDARNYYLQHLLATKAGLEFWTVYHVKGKAVNNKTKVAVFTISNVSLDGGKWITFRRVTAAASDVAEMMKRV